MLTLKLMLSLRLMLMISLMLMPMLSLMSMITLMLKLTLASFTELSDMVLPAISVGRTVGGKKPGEGDLVFIFTS